MSQHNATAASGASRHTIGEAVTTSADTYERRIQSATGQRILAVARELVAERGVDGTHIVEITRRAGIASGLVNYYFGSKRRLLGEVIDADAADRLTLLRECVGEAATFEDLMRGLARVVGELLHPTHGTRALQELTTLALRDSDIAARHARGHERYHRELAAILTRHHDAGIARLRADASTVATVLLALGQGLVTECLMDPSCDVTAASRYTLKVVRDMLAPA